ncbi:ATP-binding protein [Embleya sp. NPDC050154]|uniref:ATP-binding protein n=1 Tax=Embleya sp. NPDC050154 TaxID=3363988 RepID=UPI0037A0068C
MGSSPSSLSLTLLDQDAQPTPEAELIARLTTRIDAESLRGLVDGVVGFVGGDCDTAFEVRVCLAELHSNAVRHAGGATRVRVWRLSTANRLLVAVGDKYPRPPRRCADPALDAEGGRGLVLVEALACANGHVVHAAGKDVWFAVAIARRPSRTHPRSATVTGTHGR